MPSDAKKKREAKKKMAAKSKDNKPKKPAEESAETNGVTTNGATNGVAAITADMDELDIAAEHRACTGVLSSHPDARDIHIDGLSLTFHGAELLKETRLELNCGRRYGFLGLNGCGK